MLVAWLIARGLNGTLAKLLVYVGIPLLIALGIYLWINAYGDRRFQEGVTATDAKWEEASDRLREDAANSATRADDAAANRLEEYEDQVSEERNRLDEAEQNGSSPLDVLFSG